MPILNIVTNLRYDIFCVIKFRMFKTRYESTRRFGAYKSLSRGEIALDSGVVTWHTKFRMRHFQKFELQYLKKKKCGAA